MKIKNDSSILDCTPVVIYDGCHPTRWVIRQVADSYTPYAVSKECMKITDGGNTLEHSEFFSGTYFLNREDAFEEFEKKSI